MEVSLSLFAAVVALALSFRSYKLWQRYGDRRFVVMGLSFAGMAGCMIWLAAIAFSRS